LRQRALEDVHHEGHKDAAAINQHVLAAKKRRGTGDCREKVGVDATYPLAGLRGRGSLKAETKTIRELREAILQESRDLRDPP